MLVYGFNDIGVRAETLLVVLPKIRRGEKEAAMFGEEPPKFLQAGQEFGHLKADIIQTLNSGTGHRKRDGRRRNVKQARIELHMSNGSKIAHEK